jgi:hypothetical protein
VSDFKALTQKAFEPGTQALKAYAEKIGVPPAPQILHAILFQSRRIA